MNYILISTILIVGSSGILAQVLLLRELLISFYGNELTIGIILANQIILEAAGVLYAVDLLGGWVAGIFGGIVFLPILGLFNTCLIIIIFKLGSLFLLMAIKEST